LLSFSNNFGEIFQRFTKYSNITIQNHSSSLLGYEYKQLITIDDYHLTLSFKETIEDRPLLILNLKLPPHCIFNTSNNLKITNQIFTVNLLNQLDDATKSLISNTKETTQEINSATSSAFIANNMIPSGASFAFRCLISMDTIRFLRFFLIDYPENVLAMFNTDLPTSDFIPDINLEEKEEDGSLPEIFQTYEISIYLFNNCGNNLIELTAYVFVGFLSTFLIKFFFKRIESKIFKVFLIMMKSIFVWNFAMSNALSSFMSFSFFTLLAYRFPVSTTVLGKFNLYFSICMGFAMVAVIVLVVFTIKRLRLFIIEKVLFIYFKFELIYFYLFSFFFFFLNTIFILFLNKK